MRLEPSLLPMALQLYASATEAAAEFVVLAWDSDARGVDIQLLDDELRMRHDGNALSEAQLVTLLRIGRRDREPAATALGRQRLMSGALGLLTYLGVARSVALRTIDVEGARGWHFDADALGSGRLLPGLAEVDPDSAYGTELRLTDLRLRRRPSRSALGRSLSRRFGHLTDRMRIVIDGELINPDGRPLTVRVPTEGYRTERVGDLEVRWAVGFAGRPLPEDERGIAIFSGGRLVQPPFTFLLPGGVKGQLGLTYMTGELHIDELVELQGELDLRGSIDWSDPRLAELLDWGSMLVRHRLNDWRASRAKRRPGRPSLPADALAQLPDERRAAARRALSRIAELPSVGEKRLDEIAGLLVGVLAVDTEAATTTQMGLLVRQRLEVIATLRRMIRARAREQPELQDLIIGHPWLLEPGWRILRHETSLDRVIRDELDLEPQTEGEGSRRLDCFVLADTGRAIVVELKRPGIALGSDQLHQTQRYVYALDRHYARMSDVSQQRRVEGLLVGSKIRADERARFQDVRERIAVRTWTGLLQTAEEQHTEFLELLEPRRG